MKKFATLLLFSGLPGVVLAQPPSRVWTQPTVPARDVLDRLNLRLGWRAAVPMLGHRDGVASLQHFGGQVVVQTRSGAVVSFDAETGATQWMARVADAYPLTQQIGASNELFLVPNGTRVTALDRTNGKPMWDVDLPTTPSSAPSADAERFYVNQSNGRLSAFEFPFARPSAVVGKDENGKTKTGAEPRAVRPPPVSTVVNDPRTRVGAAAGTGGGGRTVTVSTDISTRSATTSGVQFSGRAAVGGTTVTRTSRDVAVTNAPRQIWAYQSNLRVEEAAVLGSEMMMILGSNGTVLVMPKDRSVDRPQRRTLDAPISAAPGQTGDEVYVATEGGNVYAFRLPSLTEYIRINANITGEREPPILWRYLANAPVRQAPVVAAGGDLFVTPDRGGIIRLSRTTGELLWQNPTAVRFLAVNPKFVYATDRVGRLLVVDRARGTVLSGMDTTGFVVGTSNGRTDRVVIAANDGTIMSLHDKAYPDPVALQQVAVPASSEDDKPKEEKPAADRPVEKGNGKAAPPAKSKDDDGPKE